MNFFKPLFFLSKHMVEHTFLDSHFGEITAFLIAGVGGMIAWISALHRRLNKIDINEHRLKVLEDQLSKALQKADDDHEKIWKEVTTQGKNIAEIKAILDMINKNMGK